MDSSDKIIGYIKYQGNLVEDGLMDARKQARALIGLDSAIRFFISKQLPPQMKNIDYEIPLIVKKGSWELLIPNTIAEWAQAGLGVAITAYLTKAAQKMAEKDFENVGAREIFLKAIECIKWFVRIVKHLGDATIKKFSNVTFENKNGLIGIKNEQGEVLYIPKEILDLYVQSNSTLLNDLASNIASHRELVVATVIDGVIDEVKIDVNEKHLFSSEDGNDADELLFPDLVHGSKVELEGEVTRENKTTNSMGFKYNGHILTAYPADRNIIPYKPLLFLRCKIRAIIDRSDDFGTTSANKPKLIFDSIEALPMDNSDLFSD